MLNKILSTLMVISLVVGASIGLFFRQSYTNITAQSNFMEKYFSVAEWDHDMCPTLPQILLHDLPNSNLIIRAKSTGQHDYTFKNIKQYVKVLEVYRGDGLKAGDQIAISHPGWCFSLNDRTAELYFVNFMQPREEYLIFLDKKIHTLNSKENNIYSLPTLILSPIFNYQDKNNTTVNVAKNYTYVPYAKVNDNEFFQSRRKT